MTWHRYVMASPMLNVVPPIVTSAFRMRGGIGQRGTPADETSGNRERTSDNREASDNRGRVTSLTFASLGFRLERPRCRVAAQLESRRVPTDVKPEVGVAAHFRRVAVLVAVRHDEAVRDAEDGRARRGNPCATGRGSHVSHSKSSELRKVT